MIGKISFALVTGASALVGDESPYPAPVVNVRIEEPVFNGVLDQIQDREFHSHQNQIAQLKKQLNSMKASSSAAIRSALGKIRKSTSFLQANPGRIGSTVSGSSISQADNAASTLGKLISEVSRLNGGDSSAPVSYQPPSKEESDTIEKLESAAIIAQDAKLSYAPEEKEILGQMRAALASSPTVVGKAGNVFEAARSTSTASRNIPTSFLRKFGGESVTSGVSNPPPYQVFNVGWASSTPDIVENRRNFEEKRGESSSLADLAAREIRVRHTIEKLAALQHLNA